LDNRNETPEGHRLASNHDGSAPKRNTMSATTIPQTLLSVSISAPITANAAQAASETGAASGTPRTLLRLEGAAALASAIVAYSAWGGRWSLFALLFLLPDLSMLGYLAGPRVGAACYNAAHSYLGPVLLAALGMASYLPAGGHAQGPLLLACIWAGHVGFDRMLGYGLKYGTGFGDTHLGRRGHSGR
jgi:hypothetical protein